MYDNFLSDQWDPTNQKKQGPDSYLNEAAVTCAQLALHSDRGLGTPTYHSFIIGKKCFLWDNLRAFIIQTAEEK